MSFFKIRKWKWNENAIFWNANLWPLVQGEQSNDAIRGRLSNRGRFAHDLQNAKPGNLRMRRHWLEILLRDSDMGSIRGTWFVGLSRIYFVLKKRTGRSGSLAVRFICATLSPCFFCLLRCFRVCLVSWRPMCFMPCDNWIETAHSFRRPACAIS